jgi:flagellar motor protein MotB
VLKKPLVRAAMAAPIFAPNAQTNAGNASGGVQAGPVAVAPDPHAEKRAQQLEQQMEQRRQQAEQQGQSQKPQMQQQGPGNVNKHSDNIKPKASGRQIGDALWGAKTTEKYRLEILKNLPEARGLDESCLLEIAKCPHATGSYVSYLNANQHHGLRSVWSRLDFESISNLTQSHIKEIAKKSNISMEDATLFYQRTCQSIINMKNKFHITGHDVATSMALLNTKNQRKVDLDIESIWEHYNKIKSKLATLTPEWRIVHDKWGIPIGDIEYNMLVVQQSPSLSLKHEIGEKIRQIDAIVDADPIFNTLKNANTIKRRIFKDVGNGSSVSDAYEKLGYSNLEWVANKAGLNTSDLDFFKEPSFWQAETYVASRASLGKKIVEYMPQLNTLFAEDGYYKGVQLYNKKYTAFKLMNDRNLSAKDAFDIVVGQDERRLLGELAIKMRPISETESHHLEDLVRMCRKYDDKLGFESQLTSRIKKFLIEKQGDNICRQLRIIAVDGDNMKGLEDYLKSNGY